jgi:hypothetical protein
MKLSIWLMNNHSLPVKIWNFFIYLGFLSQLHAEPTLVSTVPTSGATGVSPSAPVVFTFSEEMNPDATEAQFIIPPSTFLVTSNAWNASHTVLTCTPTPAFPANKTIIWAVNGENPNGEPLGSSPAPGGFFNTGSGGSSETTSGTNQFTTFTVGKQHVYAQTSTGAPFLDPTISYAFNAMTSLASNRTATNVSLTLPSSVVTNLTRNFFQPENFYLYIPSTNIATFNSTFGTGNYVFMVSNSSSNQQVTVNLPGLTQPNAPHVANYTAAQSVNPAQSFLLTWDAFTGGTAADYISVNIGGVFMTPNPGVPGALNGTATSVNIPANTLLEDSDYESTIGFYRAVISSNANHTTIAYVATTTRFNLTTTIGSANPTLILTNGMRVAGVYNFDVVAPASATVTVESSTNLAPGSFAGFLTTNTPAGGRFHVTDHRSTSNRLFFYRARTN